MKYLKNSACCMLLSFFFLCSAAQRDQFQPPVNEPDYNKPRLFADLPERMNLDVSTMESLLDLPIGYSIVTKVNDKFPLRGTVVSRIENNGARSVVVRLANRSGATLTFTSTLNPNGTISYIGRIISLRHADAFNIVQQSGQLVLQKKGLYDLISE